MCLTTALIALLIRSTFDILSLAPFFLAAAVAAWYGGMVTGIMTIAACVVSQAAILTATNANESIVRIVLYVICALILVWLMSAVEDGRRRAAAGQARLLFLSEAGAELASSLDYKSTVEKVTSLAVPQFADWCSVYLVEPSGSISLLAVANADQEKVFWAREQEHRFPMTVNDGGLLPRVIRSGEPECFRHVTEELFTDFLPDSKAADILRQLNAKSVIAAPLTAREQTLGALVFVSTNPSRLYSEEDVIMASVLARRCALAIDNAKLFQAAEAAQLSYSALFEEAADAILVTDSDARYVDANRAALEMLGFTRDELLALRVPEIVAAPISWGEAEFAQFLADRSWSGELELRRKDGGVVPVEARATSVDIPGRSSVHVAVLRDVSERRALDRMQRDFVAMISHDLKGPLTSLRAYAQLMRRREAYSKEAINTILAQTERMERLINDLLDVAQIEAGQLELRLSHFDLSRLIDDTVAAVKPLANNHQIIVEEPGIPIVGKWDADRIEQVLHNLITNAIKYSLEGTTITVRVTREESAATIAVVDEGPGIAPEEIPKLFQRFFRVQGGVRGGPPGLGLGLYISRLLVEAHGGTIAVFSQLGQGSTFQVELPISPGSQIDRPNHDTVAVAHTISVN
jgi:PAS domain S-box-containing protein